MTDGSRKNFPHSQALALLRKARDLTQAELGAAVLEALDKTASSKGYAQKLVSLWERGEIRPSPEQIKALSVILRTDEATIQQGISKESSTPAIDLFNQLRDLQTAGGSSLLLACFSSPPKASVDPDTFNAVAEALVAGVAFALVVPYPASVRSINTSPVTELLESYYRTVRAQVEIYCRELVAKVGPEAGARVAVFVPNRASAASESALFPPHQERTVLVIRNLENLPSRSEKEKELYLWVKTSEIDALKPAAEEPPDALLSHLKLWESYFREIIDIWRLERTLTHERFATCTEWALARHA